MSGTGTTTPNPTPLYLSVLAGPVSYYVFSRPDPMSALIVGAGSLAGIYAGLQYIMSQQSGETLGEAAATVAAFPSIELPNLYAGAMIGGGLASVLLAGSSPMAGIGEGFVQASAIFLTAQALAIKSF
jgi:hypothetical protein